MIVGVKELVTCRYDASKDLESSCGGYVSYGKVEIEAAAGNSSTTSLSLFMETYALEVEEELSSMATQCWAEGVWTGTRSHEQKYFWMRQIREVKMWKQVRGPAGAVMCETRDLGIKWPHWHTLIFGNDTKIDMRFCVSERR